jgi:hypothetical protein
MTVVRTAINHCPIPNPCSCVLAANIYITGRHWGLSWQVGSTENLASWLNQSAIGRISTCCSGVFFFRPRHMAGSPKSDRITCLPWPDQPASRPRRVLREYGTTRRSGFGPPLSVKPSCNYASQRRIRCRLHTEQNRITLLMSENR